MNQDIRTIYIYILRDRIPIKAQTPGYLWITDYAAIPFKANEHFHEDRLSKNVVSIEEWSA